MIKAEKISKIVKVGNQEIKILDNVSLEIEKGTTVAIVGKSGCGKTTLLSILSGIDKPTSGTVTLNDCNYFQLTQEKQEVFRNENIGVIFQNYHLIPELTCEENIRMPLVFSKKKVMASDVEKIMQMVGIEKKKKLFPKQMSGGEQQRAAIARALVNNPSIIFADEPTGALDGETGNKVVKFLIASAHKMGLSVMLVTHDMDVAKQCDRIIRMADGKIVC